MIELALLLLFMWSYAVLCGGTRRCGHGGGGVDGSGDRLAG
jgi:hypothetical protein